MKKCIVTAVCALSLLAGTSIYATDSMLKSCTIDNGSKGCSVNVAAGKDTLQVKFVRFPVGKETDKLACKFTTDNVDVGQVTGAEGDVAANSHIDQAKQGQLTINLVGKFDENISGAVDFDVTAITPFVSHSITFSDCKVLK